MSNAQKDITNSFAGFAEVALDRGPNQCLDYGYLPEQKERLHIGSRVRVLLRNRIVQGTVTSLKTTSSIAKVQGIQEVVSDKSFLSRDLLLLAQWMSIYYCAPLNKVFKALFPSSIRNERKKQKKFFVSWKLSPQKRLASCRELRKHKAQAKILDLLLEFPEGMWLTELLKKTETSLSPVKTLIEKNILQIDSKESDPYPLIDCEFFQTQPKKLTEEQASCLDNITQSLTRGVFQTHLIYGVTGSGKTEIYMQAITKARSLQKGVILLVPEIALTSQTIERLKSRFQEKLGILHYRMGQGERFAMWHAMHRGEIHIIVGARSAVFSPLVDVGLIIVDEEHESSYKQTEEMPCYHARDVAVMRGKLAQATVVLGSATPFLESYYNAQQNKYKLNILTKRPQSATLPHVHIIDMKRECEKAQGFTLFSQPLIEGIKKRVEKGEQTLLLLNRRGYHTFQLCSFCGKSLTCPHCDLTLTFHKKSNLIMCHLCSYTLHPPPQSCPSCHHTSTLQYKGVGTEQVEKRVHQLFPSLRTLRMDADTTRRKGSHDLILKQFRSGKADVLIGTQMIAKGLHFPCVTLVGVLNSDAALHLPDFRSSEMLFQLLTQVSGRSGRGDLRGEVIIQTRLKNHPLFAYAAKADYQGFFDDEIAVRRSFLYPPFTRLTQLIFSGTQESFVLQTANDLRSKLCSVLQTTSYFPSSLVVMLKSKINTALNSSLKGSSQLLLSKTLQDVLQTKHMPHQVRLLIDVDPLSTFT